MPAPRIAIPGLGEFELDISAVSMFAMSFDFEKEDLYF
jgi:hypothetical protein